jgi:hypothetical protein
MAINGGKAAYRKKKMAWRRRRNEIAKSSGVSRKWQAKRGESGEMANVKSEMA